MIGHREILLNQSQGLKSHVVRNRPIQDRKRPALMSFSLIDDYIQRLSWNDC